MLNMILIAINSFQQAKSENTIKIKFIEESDSILKELYID